jgi:hypothetical protein
MTTVTVGASDASSTAYTADNATWPTADGGILTSGASDFVGAEIISAIVVVGGGYYPPLRPLPVIGVGYGVLPRLVGEAHGVVGVGGAAAATLPIAGEGVGVVDDFDDLDLLLMLAVAA